MLDDRIPGFLGDLLDDGLDGVIGNRQKEAWQPLGHFAGDLFDVIGSRQMKAWQSLGCCVGDSLDDVIGRQKMKARYPPRLVLLYDVL